MNRGVPPTARKARTGEFTPPGMTRWARSNSSADFGAFVHAPVCTVLRDRAECAGAVAADADSPSACGRIGGMDIEGSVAVITGGASGLGLATARTPVRRRRAGRAPRPAVARRARSARAELGGVFAPADVTDEAEVSAALDAAAALGPIRVVVNCAGIGTPGRVIGKNGVLPLDQFTKVVTVNLIGTFNVLRLGAERILANDPIDGERGVIVNTASAAAFDGQIGQAAYSASKGGVVGMTLPIARDLADKLIRVMTIAPGLFNTPMLAGPAAGRAGFARPPGAAPEPARRPERVRRAGRAHRRQPDAQRRGHPPRRRDPHGARASREPP